MRQQGSDEGAVVRERAFRAMGDGKNKVVQIPWLVFQQAVG